MFDKIIFVKIMFDKIMIDKKFDLKIIVIKLDKND